MKIRGLAGLMLVISIFSCKKDKNPKPVQNQNLTAVTGTPSSAILWHGELSVFHTFSDTTNSTSVHCSFFSVAGGGNTECGLKVQSVIFNDTPLFEIPVVNFQNQHCGYSYSLYPDTVEVTHTWSVSGSNGIPTFTFADSGWPQMGTVSLPDTVSKTANTLVNVNGIIAATGAYVTVMDNSWHQNNIPLANGSNTVNISSLVALLNSNSVCYIDVVVDKIIVMNFAGKDIAFKRSLQYQKSIHVVP